MKVNLFIVICLLTLILTAGCDKAEKTNIEKLNTGKSDKLTLEIVRELSKKGDKLSWKDFEAYDGKDIGSGLYIMEYPIDDKYLILVGGGNPEEKPIYIRLVRKENKDTDKGIDIRYEDIDKYVNIVP